MLDVYKGVKDTIDTRVDAAEEYATRVASKNRVLDIGGRNALSRSGRRIRRLGRNPNNIIVSTDILPDYEPDIVDDICSTSIKPNSFDGVFCVAVLEHVKEYWKAVDNIYSVLETGGEIFIDVPFFSPFHSSADHHRFTFTEIVRMLGRFSEVKVFTTGKKSGYGFVFWEILSFSSLDKRYPRLTAHLTAIVNSLLKMGLYVVYKIKRHDDQVPFEDYSFYYIYLKFNDSFCAWAKK